MYNKKTIFFGIILSMFPLAMFSQELTPYQLSIENAIEMGLQNHQQLKIAAMQVQTGEQQVTVAKLQHLPTVTFSANAFYLGDALILDTDWSKLQTVDMPHFGNTFALQASQLLYKGGIIKKSVEMAELQQQLAELNLASNVQDIKFLIISNYLDILKLINQLQVLEQNKTLAEQLLANITNLYNEEMVTRNELIRAELLIKNLNQAILTMQHNHAIMSNRLSYALGLPNNVLIIPTEDLHIDLIEYSQNEYIVMALHEHPALRLSEKNVQIAEKNIDITKANQFPSISLFGGYNMQRPLTSSTPVMDLYNNTWQAGVSLNVNIDNLFRTKQKVKLSRLQAATSQEALVYAQQNVETGVVAAFLKFKEVRQQMLLMEEAKLLANENYEIVRAKYLNQLVITAEMTDASNTRLQAELEYSNTAINALFQYYNLLKATGRL